LGFSFSKNVFYRYRMLKTAKNENFLSKIKKDNVSFGGC
jgi:hypothetical protein